MTLQTQANVFDFSASTFGGAALRRLSVWVGGQPQQLLIREQPEQEQAPYLLLETAPLGQQRALYLNAEWGEPLAEVCALQTNDQTGQIEAYILWARHHSGASKVTLSAADTYWWQGQLYGRKKALHQLRNSRRGKKVRGRSQAA